MTLYFVENQPSESGEYRVHSANCPWLPEDPRKREILGDFTNCYPALVKAKEKFDEVNGCAHCVPDCYRIS